MSNETRLWQHEGLWRIQSLRQLPDRHGIMCDAWESWRDEHGHVLFFETEEEATMYRDTVKLASAHPRKRGGKKIQ